MKVFLIPAYVFGLVLASISAHAEPVEMNRVLRDQTTTIAVELSEQSVRCNSEGYRQLELKVSVPDLDWLAEFDHRVFGEGVPCMTAGRCTEENRPETVLAGEKIATTRLRSILSETILLDSAAETCENTLSEKVTATIKGKKFDHIRSGQPRKVAYAVCTALIKQPTRANLAK